MRLGFPANINNEDPFDMEKDVIFRGKLDAGRFANVNNDDQYFWCVWKDQYLVGKVQNGTKVYFRIINLTTLNFKVTRIPIDRKLLSENGSYTQLFYLYRDSILNLAILESSREEDLVFVEYDLNSSLTTYHPALRLSSRNFVQEMTLQNTVVRGKYFYFVRKVVFEISSNTLHVELFRYNLEKKGRFRCISKLPNVNEFPLDFAKISFETIASDHMGIILFGIRESCRIKYSEQVALLDVARNRWTLFPNRRNGNVRNPPYTTLEKLGMCQVGGDMFYLKRADELELWKRNMFTRTSTKLTKVTGLYVELVHCLEPNSILIVTRRSDEFFVVKKPRNIPKSLAELCAQVLRRHNIQGMSNADLRAMGVTRPFVNKLLN